MPVTCLSLRIAAWRNPLDAWRAHRAYKVKLHPIGRLRFFYKFRAHGERLWHRTRYWPTRRRVLDVRRQRIAAERQLILDLDGGQDDSTGTAT